MALAAGCCAACGPPALAQEMTADLRGPVLQSEIDRILAPRVQARGHRPPATGTAPAGYVPFTPSPTAVEDETTSGRRGAGVAGVTESAAPAPLPARKPSTARERERRRKASRTAADAALPLPEPGTAGLVDAVVTGTSRADPTTLELRKAVARARSQNSRAESSGRAFEAADENPYAPLGLRVGTFTVIPTLEQGITWSSNATSSSGGREAVLSETTLRLGATSNWSRHEAALEAYGTYRRALSGDAVRDFQGGVDGRLRFDIASDYAIRAGIGYDLRPESASSPVIITGVEDRPLRHTIDGSLGAEKRFGRLRMSLTGSVSRDIYGEARLAGGAKLSQRERNATLATLRLRTGYQVSPMLAPFVEGEIGRRLYDLEHDAAGYDRSANRYGLRVGAMIDAGEKLSGEASVGWLVEDLDDSRLKTISGLALAASLNWSPERGTTVGLDGSTTVEGTTDAGASGSILYAGVLRLERQVRSNLTAEAAAGLSWRDYAAGGHDLGMSGQAAMTWWLNRGLGLTGRVRYERQTSSLPGRDFDATSVFLGVRMQR